MNIIFKCCEGHSTIYCIGHMCVISGVWRLFKPFTILDFFVSDFFPPSLESLDVRLVPQVRAFVIAGPGFYQPEAFVAAPSTASKH